MNWYPRTKLALDVFRRYKSTIIVKLPQVYESANLSQFSTLSNGPQRSRINFPIGADWSRHGQLSGDGAKRFYHVGRDNLQHFKRRGFRNWLQNPRKVVIVVVVCSGIGISVYFGNIETVPYTRRKHFVLLSKSMEKKYGEVQFENIKEAFKGKILPATHPESRRVHLIANDIIYSLKRGLGHRDQAWNDLGYASPKSNATVHPVTAQETWRALTGEKAETQWSVEDDIVDDKWIEKGRKKGIEKAFRSETSHLDGLNWEVLVVNMPVINAFCLPGGKIVVFTGLLNLFRSNAEIATIISHEVGHAVARHIAEMITKNLWLAILQIILYQFVHPDIVNTMSSLLLKLPFSRKMEIEADHMGLLLMASAGYDPRKAPHVYEKLGKVVGDSKLMDYLATHPSGKKRAALLARAHIMEVAISLYRESGSGKRVEGFII